MTDMQGNERDVPFDFGAADALIAAARDTAAEVQSFVYRWSGHVMMAKVNFAGVFAEIFDANSVKAGNAGRLLAARLEDIAAHTEKLRFDAEKEQQRRIDARQWYADQEDSWRAKVESAADGMHVGGLFDAIAGAPNPPDPPTSGECYQVTPAKAEHREVPKPGSGGGGGAWKSSAEPDRLIDFSNNARGASTALAWKRASLLGRYRSFQAGCQWGELQADGVFIGFEAFNQANDEDAHWAAVVGKAFASAGKGDETVSMSNSSLYAKISAAGVDVTRDELQIDPAIAIGHPPTTGYADDPINTATGNFVHSEIDLPHVGGCSELAWDRTYNSIVLPGAVAGCLGPGWSTWAEAGIRFEDDLARVRLPEGREIHFGRDSSTEAGWGRSTEGSFWLAVAEPAGSGHVMSDNEGGRWHFDASARLQRVERGPGTGVTATWEQDRLVRLAHDRGRGIDLTWAGSGPTRRLREVRADDGRTVTYDMAEDGRLSAVTLPGGGTRTYDWDDAGLIAAVTDPDGVVELENTYDDTGRVASQRSPHGRTTRYSYLGSGITEVADADGTRANTWIADAKGRLIGVVDADDRRQSTAYDRHGNPVMITGRDGAVTTSAYDERGRLVKQRTPQGADLAWTYDDLDRLTGLTVSRRGEELGTTSLSYDGESRQPSEIVDGQGGASRFTWRDGLLTEVVDPTGVRVAFEQDAHGDLIATTDAQGRTARLERDGSGRVVAAISPAGDRTVYAYGESGLLASRTDATGGVWSYEYTGGGRMSAVVDPTGARTSIEHDAAGDVGAVTDPLGHGLRQHFDDIGQLASVELPDGSTWRYTHDALSRLVEVVDPAGGRWQRTYDEIGDLTSTTDPTGVVIQTESRRADGPPGDRGETAVTVADALLSVTTRLDVLGRVVAQVRPDGSTELRRHDRCGRVVEIVDEVGGATQLVRDAAGRVVEVRTPGGQTVRMAYDACGRVASRTTTAQDGSDAVETFVHGDDGRVAKITAPTGEETTWTYDALGRVTRHHRPGVGTTTFERDAVGRITTISDPSNGRRQLTYDAAGRLISATDANGGTTRFELDALGRVLSVIDPLGARTERAYDVLGRLVAETDPLGRTRTWAYDAAGRLIEHVDATGAATRWTHDASGRDESRTATAAGDAEPSTSVRVTRDIAGRRMVLEESAPAGSRRHELGFDPRGLLVSRTRDGAGISWTYDADGRTTGVTRPDGSTTRRAYAADGLLARVEHPLLGTVDLTRDASGRVVSALAQTGQTGQADQRGRRRHEWRYDGGWLAAVTTGATAADPGSITWLERDDEGRVATVRRDGAPESPEVTSYQFDEARQLTQLTTGTGSTRFRYDHAGRLVSETIEHGPGNGPGGGSGEGAGRSRIERRFDSAGQLIETSRDGAVTTHVYDAAGRRIADRCPDGTSREYAWDATGTLTAVASIDADGARTTRELSVDALGELAAIDGTAVWWDPTDPWHALLALGDTPVIDAGPLTGIDGTWSSPGWRPTATGPGADPWQPQRTADLGPASLTAAGELILDGLEWLHARAYDPATRSFLSPDPLPPVLAAGWAGNPYAYAGNDPLHALDPLGLSPVTDAELQAYRDANKPGILKVAESVGEFAKDNWEYAVAAGMVVGGGLLIASGVGGPAGMALISGGLDVGIQKATTGEVNWKQAAVSTLAGGLGAGAGGAIAKAGLSTAGRVVASAGANAAIGASANTANYVFSGEKITARGILGNAVGGAVGGGIGGASGGSALIHRTRAAQFATAGFIEFTGGASGQVTTDLIADGEVNAGRALFAGGAGATTGRIGDLATDAMPFREAYEPRHRVGAHRRETTFDSIMFGHEFGATGVDTALGASGDRIKDAVFG